MSLRTSPIAFPPSSSAANQTTPALRQSRLGADASSSSSPPPEVLATPRDGQRIDGKDRARSKKGAKPVDTRRSVRVRESSGNRSSPAPKEDVVAKLEPSNLEHTSNDLPHRVPFLSASSRATSRPHPRPTLPPRPTPAVISTTLALAQAHGITADQFEEAKQQVMRFLRTDAVPPPVAPLEDKGKSNAASHKRSTSLVASNASVRGLATSTTGFPSRSSTPALVSAPSVASLPASPAATRSASTTSTQTFASPTASPAPIGATGRTIRTRLSLEEIAERTGDKKRREEDARKEREMRRWAEQSADDSSEEEPVLEQDDSTFVAQEHTPRLIQHVARRSAANSPLLPSPSFPLSTSPGTAHVPPSFQASLAKRGMMERFMSDREGGKEEVDASDAPVVDAGSANVENAHQPLREAPPSPSPNPRLALVNSPPRQPAAFSPSAMMTSPVPSRGRSLLFSPDVARLLRSELDELEANGSTSRKRSSRKKTGQSVERPVEEHYSSPYNTGDRPDQSPSYSSSRTKRPLDVFSSDESDSTKRPRWSNETALNGEPVSPTPSTLSMRAPSFCDSSPPMSDKASNTSVTRPAFQLAMTPSHPASAPDFLYDGLPSSSPASSPHAYSDYGARTRPTPAPSAAGTGPSPSTSTSTITADSNSTRKRAPLKRAETLPTIHGPESHAKPTWSYAALIGQAVFSTETRKISLAEIYTFIMASYPYYKKSDAGWQNSIRHNLSLNECFIKTARGPDNPGKGCLWAIAPGCEEQFADGGFFKKGAGPNGKKTKVVKAATRFDPTGLLRAAASANKRSREDSPHSSSAGASPAPSSSSNRDTSRPSKKAPSRSSARGSSPASQSPIPTSSPHPIEAPPATAHLDRPEPSSMGTRGSLASLASAASSEEAKDKRVKVEVLAPAYVHRPAPRTSPGASQSQYQGHRTRRHALTSPARAPASPPTSVYNRLAGPYQPILFSQPSAQSHRALALLASPEAAGIMPVHPSICDRPLPQVPSHNPNPHSQFLPAPHIFPGLSRHRQRTSSDEKEGQSMMSPTALTHTQSPVSSMRGGPRAPMSPVQASEEKSTGLADPEKKRASGLRHLPAVAALADAADTFGTPPRHLRSPSARSMQSVGALQAAMSTPGGRRWGTPGRPGVSPSMADGAWGWGDPFGGQVEAELDRMGDDDDSVLGSGSSSLLPRLYWPSPSIPGASHVAW